MKVFVAGSRGFIGRNVSDILESQGHSVFRGTRPSEEKTPTGIDLLDQRHIEQGLREMEPDIIINCAGVIDQSGDFEDNVRMSKNLLEAVAISGLHLHRFVMCGSAGEYGNVDPQNWPVSEETPLLAANPYAQSKVREEKAVRELASRYDIDAVVARIFNPIGNGMPAKFLVSSIIAQIEEIRAGDNNEITVSRADALRDYIDITDAAKALALIAIQNHKYDTYNVGSGKSTSTSELVGCILGESGISANVAIRELNGEPEQPVASQADISRLTSELGWKPEVPLRDTIRGIIYHESHE